jgi:Uma2 family endonuclease
MHMKWKPYRFTFDDFCQRVTDGQKADLIDGVIYMASPDNWDNGLFFNWFSTILAGYVSERELGAIVGSRVAFYLDEFNSPEPDLAFVQTLRLKLATKVEFNGPPDAAIEIVSPDSVRRDYDEKRELYRAAGVREYWIIDPIKYQVTMLRLGSRRRFREVPPSDGVYRSEVVKGFWFRPEWFWNLPRPKSLNVLKRILRERP